MKRGATGPTAASNPGTGERGFSLVEIVVALLVGAIVIVGMYQGFNTLQKWLISDSVRSDMRQNARAGLETLTRDIEMAGYQTTSYGDLNKTGLAITLALHNEIEMDQQLLEHTNGSVDWANPVYEPKLVYYHLATDMRTGRQNLYRQIRTQPGLRSTDEIVAENISAFTIAYQDKNNNPVDCLSEYVRPTNRRFDGSAYKFGNPRPRVDADYCRDPVTPCATRVPCDSGLHPDPLKNIRRITVSLTTMPAGATAIDPATPTAAGDATITVAGTDGFPASGKLDVFFTSSGTNVDSTIVTYSGKDATHFTGCVGVPANATVVARAVPIGRAVKPFTLTASVLPQNLDAADEATPDCVPPAVPTGLAVIDTRSCVNKLKVKWNKNADLDLDGYKIFYGPTDFVRVPVRALANKDLPEFTLNPDCLLITKNADRGASAAANTSAIQLVAYDSSGNDSEKSAAVTGWSASADVSAFGGANDTTVNPLKPAPPTGMTVVPGAVEGTLVVSWPAAAAATAGYRLYRSTAAFTSGAHIDGSLQVASSVEIDRETEALEASQPTWIDKNLERCRTYHYAVASVNCDETLVDDHPGDPGYPNYLYNSDPALSDYTVGSGAPVAPPAAPSLAGTHAGENRALITLTNPLAAAGGLFDRTEIFWNKGAPPHLDGTSVVDGTLVPDSDSGIPGTFTNRGSQVVVFDSETDAAPALPSLDAGETYHFLAVSRCGTSAVSASASAVILGPAECIDNPAGPPDENFFSNGTISSCPDNVVLGWEYPGTNPEPADLAGFHVERTMTGGGAAVGLTAGPTRLASWTDADALQAGAEYTYSVAAADCLGSLSIPPYDMPSAIHPGKLQRYQPLSGPSHELDAENFATTISDAPASYTFHNNVKFFLQNTSQSPVKIKRMKIAWDKTNVVLKKVKIGGAPSGTVEREFAVDASESVDVAVPVNGIAGNKVVGKAWERTFLPEVAIADVAGGVGAPSGAIPMLLSFATPAGTVNDLTDLRGETLNLSLWVLNGPPPGGSACDNPYQLVIEVPRGPELGCFTQSVPGSYGIDSYEVAGSSGTARDTDVSVSTGVGVNVFGGKVLDSSRELFPDGVNRGFDILKVYGASAAAANPTAVPVMPTPSTFERPLQNIGGDRYALSPSAPPVAVDLMPQQANKVHWYYALAVDKTGNWDRVPSPVAGNYAYFQEVFDVCSVKPRTPVEVSATKAEVSATNAAADAIVTWCAPEAYVNGDPIAADDRFTYEVFASSDGGGTWAAAPSGTSLSSRIYTHNNPSAGTYIYRVRAKSSCVACTSCAGLCCSDYSADTASVTIP